MRSLTPKVLTGSLALCVILAVGCVRHPDTANERVQGSQVQVATQPPPPRPPAAQVCDSAKTQLEMTACRTELAEQAEAVEAESYDKALAALKSKNAIEHVGMLNSAEQKWKDYRDAQCQAAGTLYSDGSAAPMIRADCRARLANERVVELRAVYQDWMAQ